jgi:hypothetical protein
MLAAEWNLEDAIQVAREEAWENRGKEDERRFLHLVNHADSLDDLKKMLKESFSGGRAR